jgi:signal transduction histidine kinase
MAAACSAHARIVAEGLTNIALHARAGAVTLSAHRHDERIELELKDDGIGFDARPEAAQKGHYGLIGMRERARLIGGKLSVESTPGAGTIAAETTFYILYLLFTVNSRTCQTVNQSRKVSSDQPPCADRR